MTIMKDTSRIDVNKAVLGIAIILLAANVIQFTNFDNLKKDFGALSSEFNQYKENASSEINALELKNSLLNGSYRGLMRNYTDISGAYAGLNLSYLVLNDSYRNLSARYSDLTGVYTNILTQIDYYQNKTTEFMDWLRTNSRIDSVSDVQKRERVNTLLSSCFNVRGDECQIKTACLDIANEKWFGLSYNHSKLDSLSEFLNKGTGDCKDYSMLYKAEVNNLLAKCENLGTSRVVFESYIENKSAGRYWLGFSEDEGWFLESGYSAFRLKDGYKYPAVICGELFDLNTKRISGHCMVAFTRNRMASGSDGVKELIGAPIVEPQSGIYVGLVEDGSSGISLRPSATYSSYIFLVMTDSDILLFDDKSNNWNSYSGFNESLTSLRIKAVNESQHRLG
jgi:hypothetical protein